MEYEKLIKLDVTNTRKLKTMGYDDNTYYCGNYSNQHFYTKAMQYVRKLGVPITFNKACFKHDRLYTTRPSVIQKLRIDYVFLRDMMKLLNKSKSAQVKAYRPVLKRVMILYYIIVTLATPIYMWQGKVKK